MATETVFSSTRPAGGSDATIGLTIIAFLLALTLGFSAADIQRERAIGAQATNATTPAAAALDGRGKWGGYM